MAKIKVSIIEIVLCVIIPMVMISLMFNIPSFVSCLYTTRASQPFTIPACPIDRVLIAVVNPVLIFFKYHHHATHTV